MKRIYYCVFVLLLVGCAQIQNNYVCTETIMESKEIRSSNVIINTNELPYNYTEYESMSNHKLMSCTVESINYTESEGSEDNKYDVTIKLGIRLNYIMYGQPSAWVWFSLYKDGTLGKFANGWMETRETKNIYALCDFPDVNYFSNATVALRDLEKGNYELKFGFIE